MKKLSILVYVIIVQHFSGFTQAIKLDTRTLTDGTIVIIPSR